MFTRLIASFLALTLLWSGFSSWEWEAPAAQTVIGVAAPGAPIDDGSVEDHHLDDQPVQSPSDLAGLLPSGRLSVVVIDSVSTRPFSAVHPMPDTPFLEGLRRPPRSA